MQHTYHDRGIGGFVVQQLGGVVVIALEVVGEYIDVGRVADQGYLFGDRHSSVGGVARYHSDLYRPEDMV